jgi:uncharacterized glyoxalase superfamily protein PhnB
MKLNYGLNAKETSTILKFLSKVFGFEMIYVTQGHESGIGLEIFLKSFLLLSKNEKKIIRLVVDKVDLAQNLADLKLDAKNIHASTSLRTLKAALFLRPTLYSRP